MITVDEKAQMYLFWIFLLVVLMIIAIFTGMVISNRSTYKIRQPVFEPNKVGLAFNSLLKYKDTREKVIYTVGDAKDYENDIESNLKDLFPDRYVELTVENANFTNSVEKNGTSLSVKRKISLPSGQVKDLKLELWESAN